MSAADHGSSPSPGPHGEDLPLRPGVILARRFRLTERVGKGGMSEIWRAEDSVLGSIVALKILPPPDCHQEERRQRFVHEAVITRRLRGEHVVEIHELFPSDFPPFFVMPLLRGQTLEQRIRQGNTMSAQEVQPLLIQLLQALGAAHSAGIVHRDVKPQNIYLEESTERKDAGPRVLLLDFGIAWDTGPGAQNTPPHAAGTPKYMAPEVGRGDSSSPHPTLDVYAAGVVAHEMLSNAAPSLDPEGHPVPLHTTERGREAGVSESLSRIISQALEPNPVGRFQTAGQFLQVLLSTQPGAATHLSPGDVIDGRYQVLAPLGRGGMAVVYRAQDLRLGGQVAVKMLQDIPSVTRDMLREQQGRFLSECEILTRLSHPNVVRIRAVGQWASCAYCVLELVEGSSLAQKASDLTWQQVLGALKGIASALDAVHTEGVVHRDVTAKNILIRPDQTAVLIDFGIARLGESWFTRTGITVGTPGGEAPEQLVGEEITAATDQWALAALVYRQLTGQFPGQAARVDCTEERILQTMENVASGSIRPLETLRPDLPPAFIAAVSRGLAHNPANRFRTCSQLVVHLDSTSPAGLDPRLPGSTQRPKKTRGFSRRLGWGLVGSLALAVTIMAVLWLSGHQLPFPAGREPLHLSIPAAPKSVAATPSGPPPAVVSPASKRPRPRPRPRPRARLSRRPRSQPGFSRRRARPRPRPDLQPGLSVDPRDLMEKAKRLMKDTERAFCPADIPDHPCHQRPR